MDSEVIGVNPLDDSSKTFQLYWIEPNSPLHPHTLHHVVPLDRRDKALLVYMVTYDGPKIFVNGAIGANKLVTLRITSRRAQTRKILHSVKLKEYARLARSKPDVT